MSEGELQRVEVLTSVIAGRATIETEAAVLALSRRQVLSNAAVIFLRCTDDSKNGSRVYSTMAGVAASDPEWLASTPK